MDQLIEFAGNNMILAGIWLALVAMLIYSYISTLTSSIKAINTHDATMLMNKNDAVVLDIRAAKEFKSGHILNARQLKPEEVREKNFKKLENAKDKPIIVVCAMGNQARGTASALSKAGFSNVSVLDGGMNAWTSASLPVSK
ncbi:rhodanese-like domain-containing protein [Alteromonas sp. KUL49]|uniref:rhodanese-like domain-containing protein n=1 Tax=Alteromonas sp. KUL49 TaxID=2480798 RepID=UPI00102EDD4F|nr:rhodanese-like domain-containing protein [Alteromonas sp. KUL49]TAP42551.1 rhodanese-like domain-containing protein [Alteromonas sp. KUL49]GEA10184.1 rhodanese-like domain-containing protein [Alteromonas sp. KUL49]